jgi:hypothetical protein
VGRGCVKVDAVPGFERVRAVPVMNFKFSLKKVEKLVARMDVRANLGAFTDGDELGKIRIELPVGHHVGQALEIIRWIVYA